MRTEGSESISDGDAAILAGTDRKSIREVLQSLADREIQNQGNQYPAAVKLFNQRYEIFNQENGQEEFERLLSELSEDELYAWTRYSLVEKEVDYISWVVAKLNRPDDREHNPYHMGTIIAGLAAAGKGRDYIENMLSHFMHGITATDHPTPHLYESSTIGKEDGVDRRLHLIECAANISNGYEGSVADAVADLLDMDTRLAPERRMTTLGEIVAKLRPALRYKNAREIVLDNIQAECDTMYGPRKSSREAPDFSREDMKMDFAMRLWADYDGKPNAEYWTLLAEEVVDTHLCLSMHLWRLEQANNALNGLPAKHKPTLPEIFSAGNRVPDNLHPELKEIYGLLYGLKRDLDDIYQGVEKEYKYLNDRHIDANERARRFQEKEGAFAHYHDRVKTLYDNRRFNGRPIPQDRGLSVYVETIKEMIRLRDHSEVAGWGKNVTKLMDAAASDLHQYGFTHFKMEPRHNHLVDERVVNNLFRHADFLEAITSEKILSSAELKLVHKANKGKGVASLSLAELSPILVKIEKGMDKRRMREFQLAANPLVFDEDGYPDQAHGTLRRLAVMEQFPLKYGPLLILAESNDRGERLSAFIARPFRLDLVVHTALTEHLKTMRRAHHDRRQIFNAGGREYLARQKAKKAPLQFVRATMAAMLARSDIGKDSGILSGVEVYQAGQDIAKESANIGVASLIKEGSGASNERGGGDRMVLLRLIAQVLQEWNEETGEPIPDDIKTMAVSLLTTQQGRALHKSEAEMTQELQDEIAEMMGLWGELDGVFKKGTFIPQRQKFRTEMEEVLHYALEECMEAYEKIRYAKGENGIDCVLDLLANSVSDPEAAGFTNSAARKLSKSDGGGKKKLTKQRAIGSNIWIALMRTHHDGYFTVSDFFKILHKALHTGIEIKGADGNTKTVKLYKKDIEKLLDSKHHDYNIFVRSLTPLARADFAEGMKRLGMQKFDYERLRTAGGATRIEKGQFKKGSGKITQEQAYLATLFKSADDLRIVSESLLDGTFIDQSDFQTIERSHKPQAGYLRMEFSKAMQARWPFLSDVQEDALKSRPALATMDFIEKRIKAGVQFDENVLRQTASAWRATTTTPNGHIVINHDLAYGRRLQPLPENPAEMVILPAVSDATNADLSHAAVN